MFWIAIAKFVVIILLASVILFWLFYRQSQLVEALTLARIRVGRRYKLSTTEIAKRLALTVPEVERIESTKRSWWFRRRTEQLYFEHLEMNSKCGSLVDPWIHPVRLE
jgi:hypothetical protein